MAFPNFTQLLAEAVVADTDPAVIGGPWPGKHVIVTDITIGWNTTTGLYQYVGGSSDTAVIEITDNSTFFLPGFYWHGHQALRDGDSLVAGTDNPDGVNFRVTGWIFDL